MDVGFALQVLNGGIRSEGEAPAEKLLANVDGEPIRPLTKMADPPEQLSLGQHGPPRRVTARGDHEPNHSSILDIDPITRGIQRQAKAEVIADEGVPMRSPENLLDPLGKALDIDVYERVEVLGCGIADQLLPHEHASSSSLRDDADQECIWAFVAAHKVGLPIRKIAVATGLSANRVHQLLQAAEAQEIPVWLSQLLEGERPSLGDADTAQPSLYAQLGHAAVPFPLYL
jgi:hypothetical protein